MKNKKILILTLLSLILFSTKAYAKQTTLLAINQTFIYIITLIATIALVVAPVLCYIYSYEDNAPIIAFIISFGILAMCFCCLSSTKSTQEPSNSYYEEYNDPIYYQMDIKEVEI